MREYIYMISSIIWAYDRKPLCLYSVWIALQNSDCIYIIYVLQLFIAFFETVLVQTPSDDIISAKYHKRI